MRYKCPACRGEGCSGTHYDQLHGGRETTEFYCDIDDEHHFYIIQLDPTEYEEIPKWAQKKLTIDL